jgi:hypothetical protein
MLDALHPICLSLMAQQGNAVTLAHPFSAIRLRNVSVKRASPFQRQEKTEDLP